MFYTPVLAAGLLLLGGAATGPVAESAAAAVAPVVLDDHHADITARLVDGRLRISVRDGTDPASPVERAPSEVVLRVKPEGASEVPGGTDFAFLGQAGDRIWLLPQTQREGLLWPGWNTEALRPEDVAGPLTWRVLSVDGPGRFALFLTGALGAPTVLFDSGDGLPDHVGVPIGTHAHGNWAFGAEGVFRILMQMSVPSAAGQVLTDDAVLTVVTGSTDPAGVDPVAPPAPAPPARPVASPALSTAPSVVIVPAPPASDAVTAGNDAAGPPGGGSGLPLTGGARPMLLLAGGGIVLAGLVLRGAGRPGRGRGGRR